MNIRNKFTHLSEIKTFDDLFSKTRIGKEVKKNFILGILTKRD